MNIQIEKYLTEEERATLKWFNKMGVTGRDVTATIERLCGELGEYEQTIHEMAENTQRDLNSVSVKIRRIKELEADLSQYQTFLVDYNKLKAENERLLSERTAQNNTSCVKDQDDGR